MPYLTCVKAYRSATVSRFRWKTHEHCGSGDPIDGRKDYEKATVITCMFLDIGGVLQLNKEVSC